jgi:hypothetical protein
MLRAAGIERRASLDKVKSGSRATRTVAKAASAAEERWLTAAADSGGVMTAARSEGLHSKLVKPFGPGEKYSGAR